MLPGNRDKTRSFKKCSPALRLTCTCASRFTPDHHTRARVRSRNITNYPTSANHRTFLQHAPPHFATSHDCFILTAAVSTAHRCQNIRDGQPVFTPVAPHISNSGPGLPCYRMHWIGLSHTAQMIQRGTYQVVPMKGKGLGAIATTFIKQGSVIVDSDPGLLRVPRLQESSRIRTL